DIGQPINEFIQALEGREHSAINMGGLAAKAFENRFLHGERIANIVYKHLPFNNGNIAAYELAQQAKASHPELSSAAAIKMTGDIYRNHGELSPDFFGFAQQAKNAYGIMSIQEAVNRTEAAFKFERGSFLNWKISDSDLMSRFVPVRFQIQQLERALQEKQAQQSADNAVNNGNAVKP